MRLLTLPFVESDELLFENVRQEIAWQEKHRKTGITCDHDHKAFEGWQKPVFVEQNSCRVYDV
ncbi:hypothetical protein GCM10007870_22270 [Gluconobacter kondonii]|uniref:Uncharacterized protein n=1 Tax=Gluconobacter kondonii TaxID=941463 RepID=A0ABQ5WU69_9PROT|nr:hypothetical protein GCM10007870_22270 [Gluconobacter kondonii]